MVVVIVQQLTGQFIEVGQLPIKAKREPLASIKVVVLKRLCVASVVFTAGGVSHVSDCRRAYVRLHQRFGFFVVRKPEDLLHAAEFPIRIQKLAIGGAVIISGDTSR